ncbi:MAG TPA: cation diffusion facilitator family transporter [Acidimicrobiia bacterium]|nr:cation diffusion facilitator family transporter [Acidimicrobiia bacterium]
MFALVANGVFLAVEIAGGIAFGSLALFADAAHMVTDVVVLGVAYAALRMTQRPPTERLTFGFARTEVLVAQGNGLLLFASAIVVIIEALRRFGNPHEVSGVGVLVIGIVGLVVNVVSATALFRHTHGNMNVRGAFWHLSADALGSLGVIVAGAGIALFGADWLDPAVSILISLLVVIAAWRLLRDAGLVLLEAVPADLDVAVVRAALAGEPGVEAVHHLHLWTTGSEQAALSAHVVLAGPLSLHDAQLRAGELKRMLASTFRIEHATIEVECHACLDDEAHEHAH